MSLAENQIPARTPFLEDKLATPLGAYVTLLVFALVTVFADGLDGQSFFSDVDDKMRMFQIRDLMNDGDWHDLVMPFVQTPAEYVTPWSRLVDAPYVVLAWGLSPLVGADVALTIATFIWPLLMLCALVWLVVDIARLLCGTSSGIAATLAMVPLVCVTALEFAPFRVDHHNVQLLLMLLMLRGLVADDADQGGVLVGAAIVASVAVGLETVPIIAGAFGLLAILSAIAPDRMFGRRFQFVGLSMLVTTPIAAFTLLGWQNMFRSHCDAFSLPWIALLMGGGAIAAAVPLVWAWRAASQTIFVSAVRLVTLAAPGFIWLAVLAVWFPLCLGGPYHMIDDISRAFWLSWVPQELSVLGYLQLMPVPLVGFVTAIATATAIVMAPTMLVSWQRGDRLAVLAFCVVIASLILALIQVRYIRFPAAMMAPFLCLLVAKLPQLRSALAQRRVGQTTATGLALSTLVVISLFLTLETLSHEEKIGPVDFFSADRCADEDFSVLHDLKPGIVMAPFGISYAILDENAGHALSAMEFHRASPGIRNLGLMLAATDGDTRSAAAQGVDYFVMCVRDLKIYPHTAHIDMSAFPLYDMLAAENPPAGFHSVTIDPDSALKVYRLDPSAM